MSKQKVYAKVIMPESTGVSGDPLQEFIRYGPARVVLIEDGGEEVAQLQGIQEVKIGSDGSFMTVDIRLIAKVEFPEVE